MRYDILLLDADETLMDFPAAERQALQRTFADHGLTFTQATDDLYQQINAVEPMKIEVTCPSCGEKFKVEVPLLGE